MNIQKNWLLGSLILGGVFFATAMSMADESATHYYIPTTAGVRGGFSSGVHESDFYQVESFLRWDLPWRWEWAEKWSLSTSADLSLGYLTDEDQESFIGTAGPLVILGRENIPVVFELGSSPTYLSRYRYRRSDFGVNFQFTTQAGFRWNITDHFNVGYRYQHMSNAGINERNPGLDMHFFSAGYRF